MEVDPALATSAAGGDGSAATELVARAWPDAYRIAWSVVQDRFVAEEAAQEACARALAAIPQLRRPERFAVWFYRIVFNECKRVQRLRHRSVALVEQAARKQESDPDERIDVRGAVAALEPRLRFIVVLRYYCQLTPGEIADVAGTSPITIRWHLMRAHRRLRKLLVDCGPFTVRSGGNDEERSTALE